MPEYNEYFDRSYTSQRRQIPSIDADILLDGIGGEQILASGSVVSGDKRMIMDLINSAFSINDGTVDRMKLGQFDDGSYGFRISDRDGNTLMNVSGENNSIESADGKLKIDLTNNRIIINDGGNDRVLIGYDPGGF